MATIIDDNGELMTAADKGLLTLLGVCGDLTYLELKTLRHMMMPQYTEVKMAVGHPLCQRMQQLEDMIKEVTQRRVSRAKRTKVRMPDA